jgi:hypothetical protein
MNAPRHTPGAWLYDERYRGVLASNDTGNAVIVAYPARTPAMPEAEAEANGRFIAAAPEMLATLEAIKEIAHDDASFPDPVDRLNNILGIVAIALAKAEGRP